MLRPDVALDLAREKVASLKKRGLLGGRDVEFDRVTDWYLLAWNDFQAAEFPFDEARKLSLALHLDVDDLKQRHKVVRASGGTVTLLTPAQRRTAGALDPDASSWDTQLDALHALMLVYDEEGLGAAQAWLDRTGRRDDQRFAALVEAAVHAIPRVRQEGRVRSGRRRGCSRACGRRSSPRSSRPPSRRRRPSSSFSRRRDRTTPRLRDLDLPPGYDTGDDALTSFYVPALTRSQSYDRSVGYFRASSLSVAAQGVSRFVAGGGTMRLLVGAELTAAGRRCARRRRRRFRTGLPQRLASGARAG